MLGAIVIAAATLVGAAGSRLARHGLARIQNHSGTPPISTKITPGISHPNSGPPPPGGRSPYSRKFQPRLRNSAGQASATKPAYGPPSRTPFQSINPPNRNSAGMDRNITTSMPAGHSTAIPYAPPDAQ